MNVRLHYQPRRSLVFFILCLFILGGMCVSPLAANAQATTPTAPYNPNETSGQPSFQPYTCQFQPRTNSVTLNAALTGADALPMAAGSYTLAVNEVGNSAVIPTDHVQISPITQRPP